MSVTAAAEATEVAGMVVAEEAMEAVTTAEVAAADIMVAVVTTEVAGTAAAVVIGAEAVALSS